MELAVFIVVLIVLILYTVTSLGLFSYYIHQRDNFFIKSRSLPLLLLYGTFNLVVADAILFDQLWPLFPCRILRWLSYMFPSIFVLPVLLRGAKIIIQFNEIRELTLLLRKRYQLATILFISSVCGVTGHLTYSSKYDSNQEINYCLLFEQWDFFLVAFALLCVMFVIVYIKLRHIEDIFYLQYEIQCHLIAFITYSLLFVVFLALIYFEVVSLRALTAFPPNYYIFLLCCIGLYISFIQPLIYERENKRKFSESVSSLGTANPISLHVEGMSLDEILGNEVLYSHLYTISKRCLCPELLHFLKAIRYYRDLCCVHEEMLRTASASSVAYSGYSSGRSAFETEVSHNNANRSRDESNRSKKNSTAMARASSFSPFASSLRFHSMIDTEFKVQTSRDGNANNMIESLFSHYLEILRVFIVVNSTYEINISHAARSRAMKLQSALMFFDAPPEERFQVFDLAVAEVNSVVCNNILPELKLAMSRIHTENCA